MSISRSALRAAVVAAVLALPALARAQEAPAPAIARPQVLSVQPLGIPALFFSGEYERAVSPNVTLGVGGTYFSPSEITYVSGDVKARFYPGTALKGFAIGVTAGYTNVSESFDEGCDFTDCTEDSVSGATLGIQLDYQWLLGRQGKYALALGAGMKRFLGTSDNIEDFSAFYPTVRASFGIAF